MNFQKFLAGLKTEKQAEANDVLIDPDQNITTTAVVEIVSPVVTAPVGALDEPTGGVTARNLLQHPATHPVVLDLILLRTYGVEFLEWDADTIPLRVAKDFSNQSLSHLNVNKILACKTLHLVDTYWQQWEIFLWCTMALTGAFPNFDVMQVPTCAQVMISANVANHIRTDVEWSGEVRTYMETTFLHDGVFAAPPPLGFLQIPSEEYGLTAAEVHSYMESPTSRSSDDHALREQVRRYNVLLAAVQQDQRDLEAQLRLVDHVV